MSHLQVADERIWRPWGFGFWRPRPFFFGAPFFGGFLGGLLGSALVPLFFYPLWYVPIWW